MCWLCGNRDHGFKAAPVPIAGDGGAIANAAAPLDITGVIRQLRTSWGESGPNTYPLANTTVSYAVLTAAPLEESNPESLGWQAMSPLMAARAAEAFELWDDLIAIELAPYQGNPPPGAPLIQFGYSTTTTQNGSDQFNKATEIKGANAYGGNEIAVTRGEIWLAATWDTHSAASAINQPGTGYYGQYGLLTYVHEIGHALGLSHPGTYNAGVGNPTYGKDAKYQQDTQRYTVMSYFAANADGSGTDHNDANEVAAYAATPLLHDIAAIQAIYGADPKTRTGHTTYGFNSTAGKDVYDFTRNANPIIAIYDAGGVDTLDLSGFAPGQYAGQVIDLTPGGTSSVGGFLTNNLAIAFNTVIENAAGGSGNDVVTGNTAANTLTGNAGDDTLLGGAGDDVLDGGAGADQLNGEGGSDTILFTSIGTGIDRVLGFEAGDRIALGRAAFGGGGSGPLGTAGIGFTVGQAATTAGPSLVFDTATNKLFFDADGTGPGAAVELAVFQSSTGGTPGAIGTLAPSWSFEAGGDFDRNGTSDVLWRNTATGATGAWSLGQGGVRSFQPMGTVAAQWDASGAGDFDDSGTSDVLWRNTTTGEVGAWLMRDGAPADWAALGTVGANWRLEAVADLTGDGVEDVLWHDTATNAVGAWTIREGHVGGWLALGSIGPDWEISGVGDLDGDGVGEVLFFNVVSREVGAWVLRNGVAADWWRLATIHTDWRVAEIGDFDGDGGDDVFIHDTVTGENGVLDLQNGIVRGFEQEQTLGPDWQIVEAGQFDGSAGEDVIYRNTVDGTVALNGFGLHAGQFVVV